MWHAVTGLLRFTYWYMLRRYVRSWFVPYVLLISMFFKHPHAHAPDVILLSTVYESKYIKVASSGDYCTLVYM